jgi:WD40 repeat protein
LNPYVAFLISFLVPLAPAFATAQETQSERGIAVAEKTPAVVQVTGVPRLMPQLGHSKNINAVAFSPDGRQVLTGSDDASAVLWDVATGKEVRRFEGGMGSVYSVAFSRDGTRVLIGNNYVLLIDIQTGEEIRRFDHSAPHPGAIYPAWSIAVSPDGEQLLIGSAGDASLFDMGSAQELLRVKHEGYLAVAMSPDGTQFLTGSSGSSAAPGDGRVHLWDISTGQEVGQFATGDDTIYSVSFSPDGTRVLTGCYGGSGCVRVWDAVTREEMQRLPASTGRHLGVAFSPDGAQVMTANHTALWDAATGRELVRFDGDAYGAVAFSPDGKRVLAGRKLWDTVTGEQVQQFEGQGTYKLTSVAWSRDGRQILTGDGNKALLWDMYEGREIQRFDEPLEYKYPGRPAGIFYEDYATPVESVAFSPDGQRVLTGGLDGRAILWDTTTGAELRRFQGHEGPVWSVAFSPDGRRLATGGEDKTTHVWDAETGKQLASLKSRWTVRAVAFSPDGLQLVAAHLSDLNSPGEAILWDIKKRKKLRQFPAQHPDRDTVTTVTLSPDGRKVLTGTYDKVILWDAASGEQLWSKQTSLPWNVAFSPDGMKVLTGAGSAYAGAELGTARLWDAATGDELVRFEAHDGPVIAVAFSPDGKWVLSGSHDRTARIWNAETGQEMARLISFDDGTWAVTDADGRFDASNGGDVPGLQWVVGLEPLALSQLKSRYYEPGLLAKILGLSDEALRDVESLMAGVDLFPEVLVTQAPSTSDRSLKLRLLNRGGGIGRVTVFVNSKEVDEDARASGADPRAQQLDLVVDLSDSQHFIAGQDNLIEVVAYNAENYLASPRMRVTVAATGAAVVAEKPQLWSIVAGTSDYLGSGLDLRFAAKDAEDFATALDVAASRLLGPDRVHITRLYDGAVPATRANLQAAFDTFKQAKPGDILVLYLAGHGVAFGGQDGDYYYLLQDAESGDIRNADIRAKSAVSSEQLTEWIKQVPALKQVMILDTCHAGQLISDMTKTRSLPSSDQRSLDRMKDRTGMFIIAGSAADAVSYEASRYGQGVLTYSLLEGMRGAALREDAFVDVGQLLTYAVDRVPALARGIGGIQQPRLATPSGGESFDMGWLPAAADLAKIPIAQERPLLLKTTFTPEDQPLDVLELTPMVNEALRARAADPRNAPFVFVEADQSAGAWRVAGRYSVTGTTVTLKVYLYRDKSVAGQFEVQGRSDTLDTLTAEIVRQVETRVKP